MYRCVVPEDIHIPQTKGIGNSRGEGEVEAGAEGSKGIKGSMKVNWNFQSVGGGLGKSFPWGS